VAAWNQKQLFTNKFNYYRATTLVRANEEKQMPTQHEGLGTIDISPTAVATIASQAVNQCYGVVAMANKNLVDGLAHTLSRDSRRGIDVHLGDGEVTVDVYVIVEYGTRIRVVAESIQNTVKFHIENTLGLTVKAVNVFVQGLRLSHDKQ
jgi:uncharacterized alkaline shock family protein YloU